jgi:hypothetical protein
MTVHLVNLTNPMMMKGPFRELIPLKHQEVSIRIPRGKEVVKIQFLVACVSPEYHMGVDHIDLVVPEIIDHEVIALDLA